MSDYAAIFVYFAENTEQESDNINEILKKEGYLFTLRWHHSKNWIQLSGGEAEAIPHYSKNVSEIFPARRVIGISCQSVVDAIAYSDLLGGKEIRVLEYGFRRERTWEKAEGKPQEWEKTVFEGREGYDPETGPQVGNLFPFFSNFDVQKIGQILDLPGFGTPGPGEKWTKEMIR